MGLKAELIAIGKFTHLRELDILDYPEEHYTHVHAHDEVLGTVVTCNSTTESLLLAELCATHPDAFQRHHIFNTNSEVLDGNKKATIGDMNATEVLEKIRYCLTLGITLWYRPNG